MKQYQEINYYGDYWGLPIVAFDKLDGSNLRFEYSQKRGFYKFGTRNMMIDRTNDPFGFAIDLFLKKYEESLTKIFKSKDYRNIQSFVCYAELICESSEFGQHDFKNGTFDLVLFDVEQNKLGFIPPRQFIKDFGHCGIPRVIYEGNLNKEFIASIKNNDYNLSEGVICKGVIANKKGNNLYYCKVKANDWFDRLRKKQPSLYAEEIKQAGDTMTDI